MDNFLFDGEGIEYEHLQRALAAQQRQRLLEEQRRLARDQQNLTSTPGGTVAPIDPRLQCPACGGPLPGQFRKCMYCQCNLVWAAICKCGSTFQVEEVPVMVSCPKCQEQFEADTKCVIPCERGNEEADIKRFMAALAREEPEQRRRDKAEGISECPSCGHKMRVQPDRAGMAIICISCHREYVAFGEKTAEKDRVSGEKTAEEDRVSRVCPKCGRIIKWTPKNVRKIIRCLHCFHEYKE